MTDNEVEVAEEEKEDLPGRSHIVVVQFWNPVGS